MNTLSLSFGSIVNAIKEKKLSADEVNEEFYERSIKLNPKYNAYITVVKPHAASGGEFGGIAIAVKDNISTKGIRTTCASKVLENYVPPFDATAIERLKAAGGQILGKTNMDEFAMGSSGENSAFGPARNPLNTDYVAGGSSSGSAVAVAAGMAPIALGTDTGGSVRAPASFTGTVGFKPTYGAISRYGLIAYANSLETVGIISKRVSDARLLFRALAGVDIRDSTTREIDMNENVKISKRIAVPKELLNNIDERVISRFNEALNRLGGAGFVFDEVGGINEVKYALPAYYTIACAEASTNLSRYDGIKFGTSSRIEGNWRDVMGRARSLFGAEVKSRIMLGTYVLSKGFYETYYIKALYVRSILRSAFERLLKSYDAVFIPTMPVLPWKIGEGISDPEKAYMADVLTVIPNLTGSPAISIPIGSSGGFKVGGQLIGRPGDDMKVLRIAEEFESVIGEVKDGEP